MGIQTNDNNKTRDDMSMEDILASIRKYVADDDIKKSQQQNGTIEQASLTRNHDISNNDNSDDTVVKLNESQVVLENIDNDYQDDNTIIAESTKHNQNYEPPISYTEVSSLSSSVVTNNENEAAGGPFNKLANALKAYGKPRMNNNDSINSKNTEDKNMLTIDKFLESIATPIIEKWVANNITKIVESAVDREIEKLKE